MADTTSPPDGDPESRTPPPNTLRVTLEKATLKAVELEYTQIHARLRSMQGFQVAMIISFCAYNALMLCYLLEALAKSQGVLPESVATIAIVIICVMIVVAVWAYLTVILIYQPMRVAFDRLTRISEALSNNQFTMEAGFYKTTWNYFVYGSVVMGVAFLLAWVYFFDRLGGSSWLRSLFG